MHTAQPSLRIDPRNPNHHLFRNNRRNWWLHYTLHLPDYTVHRVRRSLGTSDLGLARTRRDAALAAVSGACRPDSALSPLARTPSHDAHTRGLPAAGRQPPAPIAA